MKPNLHLTFQNTIPENSLRLTKTPFIEFSQITKILFLSKEEFLNTSAIHLCQFIRENNDKINMAKAKKVYNPTKTIRKSI